MRAVFPAASTFSEEKLVKPALYALARITTSGRFSSSR
jgi:hypothetical protein